MAKFLVKGGNPLSGEIALAGSKNAATKLMLASLLTDEPCRLTNFPRIGDAEITEELCRAIGSEISRSGAVLTISTPKIKNSTVQHLSRRNRIPILALGPLLARAGAAEVPVLGGDKLGQRPVNFHIRALEALGAKIKITSTSFVATAKDGLRGSMIELPFPSVGATENSILAAVLAQGRTIIKNAALEPEIISMIKMLQNMGAVIELGAERDIYIEGVEHLRGVTHEVLSDRNEAVSFACLSIATGGEVFLKGAIQEHLITFLNVIRKAGVEYEVFSDGIKFLRPNSLKSVYVETAPHPGFMTDWQQPLAVLLTQAGSTGSPRAERVSTIHETIYEDRFGYVEDLNSIGAKIEVSKDCPDGRWCRFAGKGVPHVARIFGPTELRGGGKFAVRDLRSGMVDIIAALVAKGESEIEGVEEIDRGYENVDERLRKLGAEIQRKS
ncbi:MAG: UDP-N-acetylglucosamine 1-carboxyvinyltransferase [Candidatus Ryanbacteria bacterium RIFCSPLOWO2_01_FULL_48_26]|uniref:UDP-N-acetylglucosamine 1-carboxyvinyltransferase n=1 Tax=Candidatus Ryanbacteria bacterium RIFCSPLOWO2_01_FULL_48_26 TaxID=1802126 RepID=A0A1G2GSS9_9BACT|nr:MAG: UDP-N-acetylglucosamine 1-carboxyvinyltransferase [Candidatus Ryanbacteria bacterium RIFCSPLOWO2_01_FULL_48_26]